MSEIALTPLRGGPLVTATVGIAVLTAMTVPTWLFRPSRAIWA